MRLDRYAPALGLSRSASIAEAGLPFGCWFGSSACIVVSVLPVLQLMHDADERAPLDELLARARQEGQSECLL